MNRLTEQLAKIQDPQTPPAELTIILMELAADYSRKTDEFIQVLGRKAEVWAQLRERVESDKQADKAWEATINGRLETSLRLELKSLEKLMSALKTHLRVRETEAKNQW
jgi:hypothetical protein